jgi:hypothetical protein
MPPPKDRKIHGPLGNFFKFVTCFIKMAYLIRIKEVAMIWGFGNLYYFLGHFKKRAELLLEIIPWNFSAHFDLNSFLSSNPTQLRPWEQSRRRASRSIDPWYSGNSRQSLDSW